MRRMIVIGVCLLALAGLATSASAQLLNTGFEEGTANWIWWVGSGGYDVNNTLTFASWGWSGFDAHGGNNALIVRDTAGMGASNKTYQYHPGLVLEANSTYKVSAWVKTVGSGFDGADGVDQWAKLGLFAGNTEAVADWQATWFFWNARDAMVYWTTIDTEIGWTEFSTTVTTGANQQWLVVGQYTQIGPNQRFGNEAPGPRAEFDDWSVTLVPEPASMLALGCGLLGFAIRKRK